MGTDGGRRVNGATVAVAVVAAMLGGLATAGGLVVSGAVDGDDPTAATEVRTVTDYYITRNPAAALLLRAKGTLGRSLRSTGLLRSA